MLSVLCRKIWNFFFCATYFFPPLRPPLRLDDLVDFLPRPDPLFLPPLSSLLTVAQARAFAVFLLTPRFS